MEGEWSPRCSIPAGLAPPVRVDPAGVTGPTRRQAQGPHWRRCASALYVPSSVSTQPVEQHILEQGARLRTDGAVSGWAALRWRGAAYFDGSTPGGGARLAVPLLIPGGFLRPDPRTLVLRGQLAPSEWSVVAGLPCTTVQRALFDEVVRRASLRAAVVAIDMTAAAELISVDLFARYLEQCRSRNGVVLARAACLLAIDESWSPQETWMRLCWVLDAELPPPRCNPPVFGTDGRFLGTPDLFDEEAGVVGEYQGAIHRDRARHRHDIRREELFRDHGLEYFEVVAGELADGATVPRRMRRVRSRAKFLPPESRAWTLEPPAWWSPPVPLAAKLRASGAADSLWRT